ncbi:MAG: hypothetical protein R2706_05835 [Acidimicrobiales bacterium]
MRALAERNNLKTEEVDDIIWGTSSQVSTQSGDLGRMGALLAGYDVKASGVVLDRFCGSGITSQSCRWHDHERHGRPVIAGGTEKMSPQNRRTGTPALETTSCERSTHSRTKV